MLKFNELKTNIKPCCYCFNQATCKKYAKILSEKPKHVVGMSVRCSDYFKQFDLGQIVIIYNAGDIDKFLEDNTTVACFIGWDKFTKKGIFYCMPNYDIYSIYSYGNTSLAAKENTFILKLYPKKIKTKINIQRINLTHPLCQYCNTPKGFPFLLYRKTYSKDTGKIYTNDHLLPCEEGPEAIWRNKDGDWFRKPLIYGENYKCEADYSIYKNVNLDELKELTGFSKKDIDDEKKLYKTAVNLGEKNEKNNFSQKS